MYRAELRRAQVESHQDAWRSTRGNWTPCNPPPQHLLLATFDADTIMARRQPRQAYADRPHYHNRFQPKKTLSCELIRVMKYYIMPSTPKVA